MSPRPTVGSVTTGSITAPSASRTMPYVYEQIATRDNSTRIPKTNEPKQQGFGFSSRFSE